MNITGSSDAAAAGGDRGDRAVTPAPALRGPAVVCPSCQARLDGGPVVFWCPRCRHRVQAGDLDVEYHPRLREVA